MESSKLIPVFIIILILGAGTSFYAGIKYENQRVLKNPAGLFGSGARAGFRNGNGQFQGRNGANTTSVKGEIISQDDKSITVKLPDGSSKIVILPSNVAIRQASEASRADLTNGKEVLVLGSANSDGTVTAQNIQLNPVGPTPPVNR